MHFERGFIYHVYNQGNNKRQLFFNDANYLFFVKKIKTYIQPYADILAWCLMPNHFHLMIFVRETNIETNNQGMTPSHPLINIPSQSLNKNTRSINDSIAIMLRSYTRAINKQENFSGALFRKATKAECINCPKDIRPSFLNKNGITQIKVSNPELEYPKICFHYIHNNPVKAGFVKNKTDWEYSSAKDYSGLRKGEIINKERSHNLGII